MSDFKQFDSSESEVFVESPAHQRNAPADQCAVRIAANQCVNGYLNFEYVAGEEVEGIYMRKVIRKEWNLLGEGVCGDEAHWAEFTTKIHRKFDDSGTPYYFDLNTSCGHAYTIETHDDGTTDEDYNTDWYLEDQNDKFDANPPTSNPGNWGLNTFDQTCIVWTGVSFTDSRLQSGPGYDFTDTPRCGEDGDVTVDVVITESGTVRTATTYAVGGDHDGEATSRYIERLEDYYPRDEAGPPDGNSWKEVARELLRKRTFAPFLFEDFADGDIVKRFGCGIADTQDVTMYWRRSEDSDYGVINGLTPTTADTIATQFELIDWSGGDPGDTGSNANFVSSSLGPSPAGIRCKKSRMFEPDCRVFNEQVYDGAGGFTHDPAVCVDAGPLAGFQDFIPTLTFGYTLTLDPDCSPPC